MTGRSWLIAPVMAMAALTGTGGAAFAQEGRIELGAGGIWLAGSRLGSANATLTRNQGSPSDRFTLFRTESDLEAVGGFDARLAVHLTRLISVEAGVAVSRPRVRTAISADVENGAAISATEVLAQYFIDVGAVVRLTRLRFAGRIVPFVAAGGGYLRQLHEGRTLVETGRVYRVGGGVTLPLLSRTRRVLKSVGARADARAYIRDGGFDLDDKSRSFGAISAGLYVRF